MAPVTSACSSSHEPTAKTVSGTRSRPAAPSRSWSSPTSPDPWKVNATRPPSAGPWATNAAGPAGTVGDDDDDDDGPGTAARRDGDEQAPSTTAEAAPRKVRRLIVTPHSGPGAPAWIVTTLTT